MRSDIPETPPHKPLFPESRFAINPSAKPKHLDIVGIDANGIYRVDGDTLTLAIADAGRPRPAEFESRFGSPVTLFVCRRTNELKSQTDGAGSAAGTSTTTD